MDVEWCGVLVTPPPKYHTFTLKIDKKKGVITNLETVAKTDVGKYI